MPSVDNMHACDTAILTRCNEHTFHRRQKYVAWNAVRYHSCTESCTVDCTFGGAHLSLVISVTTHAASHTALRTKSIPGFKITTPPQVARGLGITRQSRARRGFSYLAIKLFVHWLSSECTSGTVHLVGAHPHMISTRLQVL
jgi:hypothetical protein